MGLNGGEKFLSPDVEHRFGRLQEMLTCISKYRNSYDNSKSKGFSTELWNSEHPAMFINYDQQNGRHSASSLMVCFHCGLVLLLLLVYRCLGSPTSNYYPPSRTSRSGSPSALFKRHRTHGGLMHQSKSNDLIMSSLLSKLWPSQSLIVFTRLHLDSHQISARSLGSGSGLLWRLL